MHSISYSRVIVMIYNYIHHNILIIMLLCHNNKIKNDTLVKDIMYVNYYYLI